MSQNVENVKFFTELESNRWEQFKHLKDAGLTDFDIALKWHLKSTRQISRLKAKAKQNGAYKQWMSERLNWVNEEFPELHALIKKKHPKLAYIVMAKIFAKSIPTKIEEFYKEETTNKFAFIYEGLNYEQLKQLDDAARIYWQQCNRKGKEESSSIH